MSLADGILLCFERFSDRGTGLKMIMLCLLVVVNCVFQISHWLYNGRIFKLKPQCI